MKKVNKKKKGNKVRNIIIVVVVIAIIGFGGYYFYDKRMKEIEATKLNIAFVDNKSVEVNSEVKVSSLVDKVVNGTLINGEDLVDTSKLGNIKVEVVLKDNDENEEKRSIDITVVDTIKPEIEGKKEITSYVGNDINLLDGVTVSDNSKEEITATVVGDYDKNKTGSYNLKYEAVDSTGNKGEYDFVLNIISDPNNRTFTTSKGFSGKVVDGVTYIDGVLIANKTYSLPSDYGSGLTSATNNAFKEMQAAFNNEKSNPDAGLWISSGYRSYYDQRAIYNNYVARDGQANADTYSARAGHSEHQTGLAFDLNSIDDSFTYTEEGKWVHDNCYRFGLILRYPLGKESITGYMHESWHMRYVGVELATKLYNGGDWITLEEYYGIDSKYS